MQVKVLATGIAPDYYQISGDIITAHVDGVSDSYDLSQLPEGATLSEVSPVGGITPIRAATRVNGELQVTLCQRVGAGHWSESGWFDASLYDPDSVHVVFDDTKTFAGTPVVYTRQGALTQEVANG